MLLAACSAQRGRTAAQRHALLHLPDMLLSPTSVCGAFELSLAFYGVLLHSHQQIMLQSLTVTATFLKSL